MACGGINIPRPSVAAALIFLSIAAALLATPTTSAAPGLFRDQKTLSFDEGFSQLFGDGNLVKAPDGQSVKLLLDRYTGSGFISSDPYSYGFFSANIKLPTDYTAGVVVAFYLSNGDVFEKTHDELDFEFLGNVRGSNWKVQTNVYGNGSTSRGREERYILPFDPTLDYHRYSIIWTKNNIIFYVDETPIREVVRTPPMGLDFPSKPMSLYATIWDGSTWATEGGKYKVNYKFSPFTAHFTDLVLRGCRADPLEQVTSIDSDERCPESEDEFAASDLAILTPRRRQAMRKFRVKHMIYSYCYDVWRYPATFPDCDVVPEEKERFKESGHLKNEPRRRYRRAGRGGSRRQPLSSYGMGSSSQLLQEADSSM